MNKPFDPNAPGAAAELAARAGALIIHLNEVGIRPLIDPVDLMLISILPLAVKKVLTGNPFVDAPELKAILDQLDLNVLAALMNGDQ